MISRSAAVLVSCLVVLAPPAARGAPASPAILSPDQLHAGQKAVVRTVFQGEAIESFDAEILGVLKGGRAVGDIILARATTPRVERTGIAQGMSGSPVYVDGRLIGALSSGWQFSREPIFGITPITEMLPLLDLPTAPGGDEDSGGGDASTLGLAKAPAFGAFRWAGEAEAPLAEAGASAAGPATGLRALPLPLACGGWNPAALELARTDLASLGLAVVPGGRAASGGPPPDALQPGAAVALDLLRGDLSMSAIGTVTYRDGDRILIFGHPLFQSGDVSIPLSTAEITTIVPSEVSSFKLGVSGRQAGVATQDRRAAVGGRIGASPRLLPFSVTLQSAAQGTQRFHFESIEDRSLAPALVPLAAFNSLLESGGTGPAQTLRWQMVLFRPHAEPLRFADVATGETASGEVVNGIGGPLRFLFNNPFERFTLDSLSIRVEIEPRREQWTLRSARVSGGALRPGQAFAVRCELEPWRGARETRALELRIPEETPPGRYLLWVGGGNELSRFEAQRLPGRYRPTSLEDAWARLGALRPSDAVYGALLARAPELTSDGRDYPELPLSALLMLSSGSASGERGRPGDTAYLDQARLPVRGVLRGELVLEVNVDPKAP